VKMNDVPFEAETDPSAGAPLSLRQATLLARLLSELMITSVQRTTALNLAAADKLLAHARLPKPPAFDQRSEQWRWSWRSFEICATSADEFLGLARGHVQRGSDQLWHLADRLLGELAHLPAGQLRVMRDSVDAVRSAQQAYLDATRQANEMLLAQVQALPVLAEAQAEAEAETDG
jgi:hypothetical protein